MMHNWGGSWGVGNWLVMGFGMLVFWALVVAGIAWLMRSAITWRGGGAPSAPLEATARTTPSARDLLDERYARGEIGDDEYRTRRDILGSR